MSGNNAQIATDCGLTPSNPPDVIPDEMPFDVPYGSPISLKHAESVSYAAVAEARIIGAIGCSGRYRFAG